MSEDLGEDITWTAQLEKYLASTGEKCNCLAWLHKRAENIFNKKRTYTDLPCIAGGAIIAFLNAGSSSLFTSHMDIAPIALGIGSLVVSLFNTFSSYFGFAKRAEGHRIASLMYAKTHRFISIELNLPRNQRIKPKDLLKMAQERFDNLAETSPPVPVEVVNEFRSKFNSDTYKDVSKPSEANGLEKVHIFIDEEVKADLHIRIPPQSASSLHRSESDTGFLSPQAPKPSLTQTKVQKARQESLQPPAVEANSGSVLSSLSSLPAKQEHEEEEKI